MARLSKLVLAVVVALGLTLALLTTASADQAKPKKTHSAHKVLPTNLESGYVSLRPCRIADTRKGGGAIANNAVRNFRIRGVANLSGQGGPGGGCGVPVGASAITANVTVTGQTGNGYLIGYAAGTPTPLTNFVSYRSNATITVNPSLPLAAVGTEPALAIKNSGKPAHVVIDVTGYFIPAIEGQLDSSGELYAGSPRVLTGSRSSIGVYEVTVDTDVTLCSVMATTYTDDTVAAITNERTITIRTYTQDGTPTDDAVNFLVSC